MKMYRPSVTLVPPAIDFKMRLSPNKHDYNDDQPVLCINMSSILIHGNI